MPGMYPDDQLLEIFGEQVMYPGLDPATHKFTDGDFSDPLVKPSHIPAASFNLILDNLENLIRAMGFDPDNADPEQLKKALLHGFAPMASFSRIHDNLENLIEAMGHDPSSTDPEQLKKAMQHGFAPRVVGEYHLLAYEPSVAELVRLRYLPLKGQIIEISQYEELCSIKYVGDGNNSTALWWYKCDEDGTRNIDGLFMQPEDCSGLFMRGAGANSIVRTDMNNPLSPPYDGKEIGHFETDTMRPLTGEFLVLIGFGGYNMIHQPSGVFSFQDRWGISDAYTWQRYTQQYESKRMCFSSEGQAPSGNQVKPASVSAHLCISY